MSQGIKKISENVISTGRSLTIVNSSVRDNTNFEIGTLKCYPTDFGLRFKSNTNTFSLFDAINILDTYTIEESLMNNNSVSTRTIIDKNITTSKLNDYCVTNIKLENKSATTGIVASDKVKDGTIVTATLGDSCVTNIKINNKSINAYEKIMNETITTELLKGGTDTNGTIIPGCVTTPKLADQSVTTPKLYSKCVTNDKIADNVIENLKLKDFTIQGGNTPNVSKIAQSTITNYNIANKTLTTINFANGSIVGYGTSTESTIADRTINYLNIAENTVQNSNLASKTIQGAAASDGGKIAFQTITGDNIKDNSIGLNKLNTSVSGVFNNAVTYERDSANKLCVNLKKVNSDLTQEDCYMSISGHLDVVGNISGARVYNMAYSDLAEGYIPGEKLEAGDTAFLREDGKVYKTGAFCVGPVSDEYAMCLGASDEEIKNGEKVPIALVGKVHVKTAFNCILGNKVYGANNQCLGRALETKEKPKDQEYHKVLCLVRPY